PMGRTSKVPPAEAGGQGSVALAFAAFAALVGTGSVAIAHEAVELFPVAGLVKVGKIVLEGRTIFIELAAFFLEALELFVAILVERGIAGCRAIAAMTMATAARFEALLLVCDPAFGLFAAAA